MERKSIGAFLAVLRKANGMTQQQVADRLNVSNKTVSKWERDESLPDIMLIPALAEMFSVTSDEILRGQRLEPAARTEPWQEGQNEAAQERRAEKSRLQARVMIARTMSRHLGGTTIAAAVLAAGMIALFTVSYAFYKPVLGFGIFMILMMASLVTEFLSANAARTALTGGGMIEEGDVLSAEKEILKQAKGMISAAAVLVVWALPLVLIRSDVYTDSVVNLSTYLELTPVLAGLSVLVYLAAEVICVRIWPELREEHERTERKLRRLYMAAGCALALILMGAFIAMVNVSSMVTTAAEQTIRVQFDDQEAYWEYIELADDCELGGSAWMEYCQENLAERGIPWKGSITDVDKDYLAEHGYLPRTSEELIAQSSDAYAWAFYPGMQSVEGMEVCFEMVHYYVGDSGTQFGIMLFVLSAAAILTAAVLLRRKYILQAEREQRLDESVLSVKASGEAEEENKQDGE